MFGLVNEYVVVLDACVLAPMPVCDTLLRLAEAGYFIPKWSAGIFEELESTLRKLGRTEAQIRRRINAMSLVFEDAVVTGYEPLIPGMTNHKGDRHVLAAAVRCGATAIVTENLRHFPEAALKPFGIAAQGADEFLMHQYHMNSDAFIAILKEQAEGAARSLPDLLDVLARSAPGLTRLIRA